MLENVIDDIADAIVEQGYIQVDNFLPIVLAEALSLEASKLALTNFSRAGIGRNNSQSIDSTVRTDSTLWLDRQCPIQGEYITFMEHLRIGLNRRLFMGLFDFESHFSHYAEGDFYRKHLDAFKGRSNRVLSSVFYLNPDWCQDDGGELLLYTGEQLSPSLVVPPVFNRCVIFLSERFPHEVLVSKKDRYSIAGWYRVNNSTGNGIDPSQ